MSSTDFKKTATRKTVTINLSFNYGTLCEYTKKTN